MYLALSRVIDIYTQSSEPAAYQNYEQMKASVFEKVASCSRRQLTLKDVLALSLPLALDGLPADSETWTKFRDVVLSHQSHVTFKDWVLLAHSFS